MTPVDIPDLDALAELSTFASEARRRWPDMALDPAATPAVKSEDLPADWRQRPQQALARFRQTAGCHILWRDLTGRADFAETCSALTRLADTCIDCALEIAEARAVERFGVLRQDDDRPLRLAVLALGKLGGGELNFNSDVDLVFTFEGTARADGRRRLEAREYLQRVARDLVMLLDEVTASGRVWIVDTRLRPFGEAGGLVWSAGAMEQYYLTEGRPWERYALVKARPVAGDIGAGQRLLRALQPFVYKRYLDYGIFESLRAIQADIEHTAAARGRADDIKRGPGGIRELEFMVQSLQLLRGGQDEPLRQRGFLEALAACGEQGLLDDTDDLAGAYRYLRILENRLQGVAGRQTHSLPDDPAQRQHLARAMAEPDWNALHRRQTDLRTQVRDRFRQRLQSEDAASAEHPLWPVAQGDETADAFAAAGYRDPCQAARVLADTARWLERQPLSGEGRRRLGRLMPLLLDALAAGPDPDAGLPRMLELIRTVARRSAYLALLREQPPALARTVEVFSRAPALAGMIIDQPQLLDDVIDPALSPAHLTPAELRDILQRRWRHNRDDPERCRMELARFHKTRLLHIGLARLEDRLDAAATGAELSRLAECILDAALEQAGREQRHSGRTGPPVAIIAYGNLGGSALHFDSDLDLVFLHAADVEGPAAIRRIQRALHILDTPGPAGRLYSIDTRLRPNGRSGLLVSAIDAYTRYQAETAWTWEHQALTRARWVGGDPDLEDPFERTRRAALVRHRNPTDTAGEIRAMYQRLIAGARPDAARSLGMKLQFTVQFLILAHAGDRPELAEPHSLPDQITALARAGLLDQADTGILIRLDADLAAARMNAWLTGAEVDPDRHVGHQDQARLEALWAELLPVPDEADG